MNYYRTKVFWDMEFTGLHQNTTLISIGLVAKVMLDIRFYAELIDYDETQVDDWIEEHVIGNLRFNDREPFIEKIKNTSFQDRNKPGQYSVEMKGTKEQVAEELEKWFYALMNTTEDDIDSPLIEMWSDCLAYDWMLFNQLWGHAFNIPKIIYYIPFDICTLFNTCGIDPDISREEYADVTEIEFKHNAEFDAEIIKRCHNKLMVESYKDCRTGTQVKY